jgi:bifunctional non-homologous end joining protein LigD
MFQRNSRGRPLNAPAAFIHPCQPIVAKQPLPTAPGWAHELKHDGYRLQIHVRDGRVKLYTRHVLEVRPVVAGRNTLGVRRRGF